MAHTFDIRFARSAGLAGMFEASGNSFGWKGGGLLSIDAAGANVVLSRGIVSLLVRRRSQRIPAESIQEVYREGDALRVEFALNGRPRAVLPFWARDRDTAARIVQLLPTSRTFEIEESAAEPVGKSNRSHLWPVFGLVLAGIGVVSFVAFRQIPAPIAATSTASARSSTSVPAQAVSSEVTSTPELIPDKTSPAAVATSPQAPASIAPESSAAVPVERPPLTNNDASSLTDMPPARRAAPATASQPSSAAEPEVEEFVPSVPPIRVSPGDMVVPIRQGTLAYDAARSLLASFEEGAAKLTEGYRQQRSRSDSGQISLEDFAESLDSYGNQWRDLSERLLNTRDASDPALTGLRATLLAVARYQSDFLAGYAVAVRSKDVAAALRAFEDLARAEEMLERARLYLR